MIRSVLLSTLLAAAAATPAGVEVTGFPVGAEFAEIACFI